MTKLLVLLALWLGTWMALPQAPDQNGDAAFKRLTDDYLTGYLAWRPQLGTSLGLHEYDGKVTDLSRASIEAELARLRDFDQRFGQLATVLLSPLTNASANSPRFC
ncbi:exported hypothetical protein [Verrucomicrobia bacterium]|nr:exported hypothetical protein [Verrucomicrobiota bacterium]